MTVVAGSPAAYVDQLCQSLVLLNRERVRWVVVRCRAPEHNPTQLDYSHLQVFALDDRLCDSKYSLPAAIKLLRLKLSSDIGIGKLLK